MGHAQDLSSRTPRPSNAFRMILGSDVRVKHDSIGKESETGVGQIYRGPERKRES